MSRPGNVIDPIEIEALRDRCGAVHAGLDGCPGTDIAFNWPEPKAPALSQQDLNAARFLFQNVDRAAELGITITAASAPCPQPRPTPR